MASEKTPSLYQEKVPFNDAKQKSKCCSKSTASWVLGILLVALIVILSFEFLYPTVEARFGYENLEIYEEPIVQVKTMPPMMTDYISEDVQKKPQRKPWDMEFLIDPSHLCATRFPPNSEQYQQDPEVKLLMLVPSVTDHFKQRMTIRNTWGSIAEKPFGPFRLGFVLGITNNKTEDDLIKQESSTYKDIIQADFEDAFHQLTTKSVLMLKWVARRCAHAKFFLKADDDTFVNVGTIANILGSGPFVSEDKFIGGYIHRSDAPSRNQNEKYYVSEDDYPDKEYPCYASGSGYVTTGPTAVELFLASQDVMPFLPMEDVFITGLCAKKIGATLLHDPRFIFQDPPDPPSWQAYSSLATAHSVTPDMLDLVWEDMNRSVFNLLFNQEVAINTTVLGPRYETVQAN